MYLLDTNVVSQLDPRRVAGVPALAEWMGRNGRGLYLSVLTLLELEAGLLKLRREAKHARADELQKVARSIRTAFGERVLAADSTVAIRAAHLAEAARPTVIPLADLLIASTAAAHGLTVLTRNLRHFAPTGVPALDPFQGLPPDLSA